MSTNPESPISAMRAAAIEKIDIAVSVLSNGKLTRGQRQNGWSPAGVSVILSELGRIRSRAYSDEPLADADEVNVAMWFDFSGISLQATDELMDAAYAAGDAYNHLVLASRRQ